MFLLKNNQKTYSLRVVDGQVLNYNIIFALQKHKVQDGIVRND